MHNWAGDGRIRWAAIGAAVAVTLGAGGIGVVRATVSSGPKPVFVSITPCRLVDTRPAPSTVGTRGTPLNPSEIATFTVHGTNGNCTIPAGAVAIDANVTITAPTSDGFLSVFPADAPLPNASNLNWTAGQAPTPNAVTVDLSTDGKVNVFNERGTVNVIIDIVGYYEDHDHDDRYYTKTQTDGAYLQQSAIDAYLPESAIGSRGQLAQAEVGPSAILQQRMSNGGTVTLTHTNGSGVYFVRFPGMGDPVVFDQTIQVTVSSTFTSSSWRSCGVNSRSITSGALTVAVLCTNSLFAATDNGFFITVMG